MPEPIDYEEAVRDLLRRRRRKRIVDFFSKIPDPRPATPGQVILAGFILLLVGWLIHPLHTAMLVGILVLVFGFLSGFIQPRGRKVAWRNRFIDLPPEKHWTDRLYYVVYRHSRST